MDRQPNVDPEQRDQPDDREQRTGREPRPGDRARDRADAEADRQTNQREEAEEAERNQRAHGQPLRYTSRRRRQLLLLGAEIEGEKGGKQRETARVDDREAAGHQRDRDWDGVDRDLLTSFSTFRRRRSIEGRRIEG